MVCPFLITLAFIQTSLALPKDFFYLPFYSQKYATTRPPNIRTTHKVPILRERSFPVTPPTQTTSPSVTPPSYSTTAVTTLSQSQTTSPPVTSPSYSTPAVTTPPFKPLVVTYKGASHEQTFQEVTSSPITGTGSKESGQESGLNSQKNPISVKVPSPTTSDDVTQTLNRNTKCHSNPCGPHATCSPLLDTYMCTCTTGYTGAPPAIPCEPVDHCRENRCGSNSECLTGHACRCLPGYFTLDNTECLDVDECSSVPGLCGEHSSCTNKEGGYVCTCQEGFLENVETSSCEDINECAVKPVSCEAMANCVNTEGGYVCTCKEGFLKNVETSSCEDIDECVAKPVPCGAMASCVNTAGSYQCQCDQGYEGDPLVKCRDVDECSSNVTDCGVHADCLNTEGGYECVCLEDFEGNPPETACSPMPIMMETDCSSPLDCSANTTCMVGTCQCKGGFLEDGPLCLDRDECVDNPDICKNNSACTNIVGGYLCTCMQGYDRYPPNYTCTEVNKCRRVCGEHAVCSWNEYEEAFGCVCEEGFVELLSGGCVQE